MNYYNLPEKFENSMKTLLKDEYDEFINSYEDTRVFGLRCNLLKTAPEDFLNKMPFTLSKVSWAEEGFYYNDEEKPGKHYLHDLGAYYIQEPSAMSAVSLLDPKPGEIILDLCAAPGGKSTQIACRMMGEGLLVSNEIIKERTKILSSNIERLGIRNAVVTGESSEKLAGRFPYCFDRILVDAPCSGEGMFRKNPEAIEEWSPQNVIMCQKRQAEILDNAAVMLKPGGVMVYSTCTFSKEENEDNVESFLNRHKEFSLVKTERLWPHKVKGEGHFVAKFVKEGVLEKTVLSFPEKSSGKKKSGKGDKSTDSAEIKTFLTDECKLSKEAVDKMFENATVTVFGDNYYLTPQAVGSLSGLFVERPGLWLCTALKNRLEPSHSLGLSLRSYEVTDKLEISEEEAKKYIEGNTLTCDPAIKGWIPLFVGDYCLGFGKAVNGVVKNHYPKGLRN